MPNTGRGKNLILTHTRNFTMASSSLPFYKRKRGGYVLRGRHIPVFRVLKFSRFLKRRPKAGNFSDLTERIGRIEATKATVPLLEIVPAKSFTGTTR